MAELVLIFCLLTNGSACIEQRPALDGGSLFGCAMAAQQTATEFLADHPGYRLARWRCEMGRRGQRDA